MSILSRLFGKLETGEERQIREMYTAMLCSRMGHAPAAARVEVSRAIAGCKEQGKAAGTWNLPRDFGNHLLAAERAGDPQAKLILDAARREGATDDDITEWWNLHDLMRRMVRWSENIIRYSVFVHATEEDGLTSEQAAKRVHRMFPMYGRPEDFTKLTGEDRPLPHELRGRVDAYRQRHGATRIADQVKQFSSYNAFVRHAIAGSIL